MQVFVGPEMDLTLGAALKKRCSRKGVIFHFKISNEHRTLEGEVSKLVLMLAAGKTHCSTSDIKGMGGLVTLGPKHSTL